MPEVTQNLKLSEKKNKTISSLFTQSCTGHQWVDNSKRTDQICN